MCKNFAIPRDTESFVVEGGKRLEINWGAAAAVAAALYASARHRLLSPSVSRSALVSIFVSATAMSYRKQPILSL